MSKSHRHASLVESGDGPLELIQPGKDFIERIDAALENKHD